MRITLFGLLFAGATLTCFSAGKIITLDTRPGVSVSFYYLKQDRAPATLVLLSGGVGDIGLEDGIPTSKNFLVRSRDFFAAHGFNVVIVNRPSDRALEYEARVSSAHIQDLRQVVDYVKKETRLPVWLIGTSRGTVSATAAAIAFGNDLLAGIVLTASVTSSSKTGAVPGQKLAAIRIPVLVIHHERDACASTQPSEVSWIIRGLKNAPVKKLIMVAGGADPSGDPCKALHWHGFIGMEQEVVDRIIRWIKNPIH